MDGFICIVLDLLKPNLLRRMIIFAVIAKMLIKMRYEKSNNYSSFRSIRIWLCFFTYYYYYYYFLFALFYSYYLFIISFYYYKKNWVIIRTLFGAKALFFCLATNFVLFSFTFLFFLLNYFHYFSNDTFIIIIFFLLEQLEFTISLKL